MTINDFKNYVFKLARQNQVGNFDIDLFNLAVWQEQLAWCLKPIGNLDQYENGILPNGKTGAESTTLISDAVAPLITSATIAKVGSLFPKPTDYLYRYRLQVQDGSNYYGINVIQSQKENYRLNSKIVAPDATNPIAINSTTNWVVYPTSITSIQIAYVRYPIKPQWGYYYSGDTPVYGTYPITGVGLSGNTITCTSNPYIKVGDVVSGTGISQNNTRVTSVNVVGAVTSFTVDIPTSGSPSGTYLGGVSVQLEIPEQYHEQLARNVLSRMQGSVNNIEGMQIARS